jgi:hypothetical protein
MSSVRFKVDLAGIREMKRSPEVTALMRERGERVAAAARAAATNEHFAEHIEVVMDTHTISGSVCHVTSWAKNAMATEAEHGTLARALDAAG